MGKELYGETQRRAEPARMQNRRAAVRRRKSWVIIETPDSGMLKRVKSGLLMFDRNPYVVNDIIPILQCSDDITLCKGCKTACS